MTTYHHGDLRAALLDAAGRIVDEIGAAGLSVREAARRAGVSHGAPYRHFSDRDALLDALAQETLVRLDARLQAASPRDMAAAYVAFALENPQRFRVLFAGRRHAAIEERFRAAFAGIGTLAGAAAWCLAHGLAELLLAGHFEVDDAVVERVLGAVRFAQRSA